MMRAIKSAAGYALMFPLLLALFVFAPNVDLPEDAG